MRISTLFYNGGSVDGGGEGAAIAGAGERASGSGGGGSSSAEGRSADSGAASGGLPAPGTGASGSTTPPTGTNGGDFDWDKWDFKKESLPETYHALYDRLHGHLTEQHDNALRALESELSVWKALGGDGEAADVERQLAQIKREYEARVNAHSGEIKSWEEKVAAAQQAAAQAEAVLQQYVKDEVDRFEAQHEDILSDKERRAALVYAVDGGVDLYDAVELVDYPKEVIDVVLHHVKNGVKSPSAVRLALMDLGIERGKARKPSAADQIASGVDETPAPGAPGNAGKKPPIEKLSLEDARSRSIREAFGE